MRTAVTTGWALIVLSSLMRPSPGADDRPNIIVIFSDDHGYADLGCQEVFPDVRTPHLDALAAGGIRMESGYVTAPQCVPSRAGLLTGRYQNRFGLEHNGDSLEGFGREQTIAARLQRAGYVTGMTGKWHLGPPREITKHGFDRVFQKHGGGAGWANFRLDGTPCTPGPTRTRLYHLDANTEAACAFIRRHRDRPFFFYCAYRAPHVPLDPPERYLRRVPGEMPQRRRKALAMITAIDDGVGKIIATLRSCGLEEKTLIFFISDNGAPLKIRKLDAPGGGPGWDGSLNDPLNGEKGMLTEGGIRVPFLAYWKGRLPAGMVYRHPVISLDVAATAAALAGLPAAPELDGINLIPHWTETPAEPPQRQLYWRWISQSAVRVGRWKYLRGGKREYLFDLESDREEQHNVLREHPEVARRLRESLVRWTNSLQPPGLATQPMSPVWNTYFDYYLDGKKNVVPPSASPRQPTFDGWIVRNGRAVLAAGHLHVAPGKSESRTFIAATGLELTAPTTLQVRIRGAAAGSVGVAWRLPTERRFSQRNISTARYETPGQWKRLNLPLPKEGTLIHLRILLPPGAVDVDEVVVRDKDGGVSRKWTFDG